MLYAGSGLHDHEDEASDHELSVRAIWHIVVVNNVHQLKFD